MRRSERKGGGGRCRSVLDAVKEVSGEKAREKKKSKQEDSGDSGSLEEEQSEQGESARQGGKAWTDLDEGLSEHREGERDSATPPPPQKKRNTKQEIGSVACRRDSVRGERAKEWVGERTNEGRKGKCGGGDNAATITCVACTGCPQQLRPALVIVCL